MKILIEQADAEELTVASKRNIFNVFDVPLIQSEMNRLYGMELSVSSKRRWSDDIWYVTISAPYIGKSKDLLTEPRYTEVALFVDYESDTAFAMPRGGADKQAMMLLASVANKHILEPFKYDATLRNRIHSLGGEG